MASNASRSLIGVRPRSPTRWFCSSAGGAEWPTPDTHRLPVRVGERHMPVQAGYREIAIPYCVTSLSP